jgi:hypothetical protein
VPMLIAAWQQNAANSAPRPVAAGAKDDFGR